jgi:hypothetical protein
MLIPVPRHLNKKPLIAGLEPIELLSVAACLVISNIIARFFDFSGLVPASISVIAFFALKILKRGKARGHLFFVLRKQFKPSVESGYPKRSHHVG